MLQIFHQLRACQRRFEPWASLPPHISALLLGSRLSFQETSPALPQREPKVIDAMLARGEKQLWKVQHPDPYIGALSWTPVHSQSGTLQGAAGAFYCGQRRACHSEIAAICTTMCP